jgi:hypothetical protein
MAAVGRVPSVDRRKPAFVDQLLKLGEADAVKVDGRAALGHGSALSSPAFAGEGTARSAVEGSLPASEEDPSTSFAGPPPLEIEGRI